VTFESNHETRRAQSGECLLREGSGRPPDRRRTATLPALPGFFWVVHYFIAVVFVFAMFLFLSLSADDFLSSNTVVDFSFFFGGGGVDRSVGADGSLGPKSARRARKAETRSVLFCPFAVLSVRVDVVFCYRVWVRSLSIDSNTFLRSFRIVSFRSARLFRAAF
jgi:hypothetical protein